MRAVFQQRERRSDAAAAVSGSKRKQAPSMLSRSLTLAAMSLGYGVVQLDVTIVNTALDSIGTSLGGDVSQLQWVVSSYTIAFAAFILQETQKWGRVVRQSGAKAD